MNIETTKIINAVTINDLHKQISLLQSDLKKQNLSLEEQNKLAENLLSCMGEVVVLLAQPRQSKLIALRLKELISLCLQTCDALIEASVVPEVFLAHLKKNCIGLIRAHNEELAKAVMATFQRLLVRHTALRMQGMQYLGMIGCIALKEKQAILARECASILTVISLELIDVESEILFLKMFQDLTTMAARVRDEECFNAFVSKVVVRYSQERKVLASSEMITFLLNLLFTTADKRYVKALRMLIWLSLLTVQKRNLKEQQLFVEEWLRLIVQMGRREWLDISKYLLDGLFIFLLRSKKIDLIKSTLMKIALNFQMHASWDGFPSAFGVYASWQDFILLLLDKAANIKEASEEKIFLGRLVLRVQRDLIAGIARQTFQEEMDIYNAWLNLSKQQNRTEKYQLRVQRMLQLTVGYWTAQQPRSSGKQLQYMLPVFEPDLVKGKFLELLNTVR